MRPKAFISSTCYDLIDLRAELEQELRDMGLSPVLSDSATSEFEVLPTAHSIESCLHNVRNCNYFIVILSQRYGPSLKKVGFQDVSATELEYIEAKKSGKPIYMYVRNQLEIEHNIFAKSNNADLIQFVGKKDAKKLFTFYKTHKDLSATKKESNWVESFKNIIDLKQLIRRDLKLISGKALLTRMVEKGELPALTITDVHAHKVVNLNSLFLVASLRNYGTNPAMNPICYVQVLKNGVDLTALELEPSLDCCELSKSITSNEEASTTFSIELSDEALQSKKLQLLFQAEYTTITGHKIADTSLIILAWEYALGETYNVQPKVKILKYYSKTYLDSNGLFLK